MDIGYQDFNIANALGAEQKTTVEQLSIYIPDRDREGNKISNIDDWIEEAKTVLTFIGGGSTTMPPTDGTWIDREELLSSEMISDLNGLLNELKKKKVIQEKTTVVYTFIDPDRFIENINILREFLHKFGRETNQGEVVIDFDGEFFHIRQYDN